MRVICLVGIDGSGKSTVAENLLLRLGESRIRVLYAQHRPVLLAPLRWLVRRTFLGARSEYSQYTEYRARKRAASRRHRLAAAGYAAVWGIDYVLTTWVRLLATWPWGRSGVLLVDRYYVDQAVNISIALGHDRWLRRLLDAFELLLPVPDRFVYLDLAGAEAFSRKDDIQSVHYLEERRDLYARIATDRRFEVVDAARSPEAVVSDVEGLLFEYET